MIGDTHWGVRGDSLPFLNNMKNFLDDIFFPYLRENDIKTVFHLGDMVDRRKYVNFNTANRLREDFLEPLRDFDCHFIVGNHDTSFKNTNSVNAMTELVEGGRYPHIKVYVEPAEVEFDGLKFLMMPWICDENRAIAERLFITSTATVMVGHLEIAGFEMYKGSIVSHGEDVRRLNRFDTIISGHFHHRSTDGQVFYLGCPCEFTWSDYDDPKGFHVFDTETRELTFVRNPYTMFAKIWYNDSDEQEFIKTIEELDYETFRDTYVKIIISEKRNPYLFDLLIHRLEEHGVLDIQTVDDHLNLNLEGDEDIVDEAESTLDTFRNFIDGTELPVDKVALNDLFVELYGEALQVA